MAKPHQWLRSQLPGWVEEGLIDPQAAEQLRQRYPLEADGDGSGKSQWMATAFSLFGGLLIGAGIIAILGFNWEALGRPARALVAFIPLLIAQFLLGWMLLRNKRYSPAWQEGVGAFFICALGACLGILTQTYQVGGSIQDFLIIWILLSLPLLYLLRSYFVGMFHILAVTAWAMNCTTLQGSLLFFVLMGLALPFGILEFRRAGQVTAGLSLLLWTLGLLFPAYYIRLTFYSTSEGPLILIISLLACAYIFISEIFNKKEEALVRRPLLFLGTLSILILAFCLTGRWAWNALGDFQNTSSFILASPIGIVVLGMGGWLAARRDWAPLLYLVVPGLVLCLMELGDTTGNAIGGVVAANIYLLVLAVVNIVLGSKTGQISAVNLGAAILSILILIRFFDSDLPLLLKGIVFILVGTGFLTLNLTVLRKKRKQAKLMAAADPVVS